MADASADASKPRGRFNSAFVFIKPHAVTDKVKELVKETFAKHDIEIKKEGSLDAEVIDKQQKIDNHYYSIASKATILTPDKLAVPKDKFKEKFDLDWDQVLKDGLALNAMDACKKFEIDAEALDKMWAQCKKDNDLVKFGGGFYCGKLSVEGKGTYYVFNGFFMSMRSKFVAPGASIYYYVVEWQNTKWADFRGKVLGETDPVKAPVDSLRGLIFAKWEELGLTAQPNVGDNGVHASASPFEALAERTNWLGSRIDKDSFGKVLIRAGIPVATLREWCKDPQVRFGPIPIKQSIFDTLEDTDSDWCAAMCQMIAIDSVKPGDAPASGGDALRRQLESYQALEKAVATIQEFVPLAPAKGKGKSSKGDGKSAKGDGKASKGDGKSAKGDGKSAKGDGKGKSSKGDGKSFKGDGKSSKGDGKGKAKGKGKGK